MKKLINKINNKNIIYFILGIIVAYAISKGTVYAATAIYGSDVPFANSSTGLSSTTLQKALEEAYNNAKKATGIKYAFGEPSGSSTTNYMDIVNSGYKVFGALNGTEKSVCIYRNGSLACFKYNNYSSENTHLTTVFGSSNCYTVSGWRCDDSSFRCTAYSDGSVQCIDYSSYYTCDIISNSISCY